MPVFRYRGRCILFVHIPKTGGTSIEKAIRARRVKVALSSQALHGPTRLGFPCSPQHFHEAILSEMFPPGYFDAEVTVVRNPVSRIVSEYRHRMGILDRKGRPPVPFPKWLKASLKRSVKEPFFKDNHFRSQVEFVNGQTEVFRFEDGLDAPVARISDLLGLDFSDELSVPVKNPGPSVEAEVSDHCVSLIARHFARDFEEFGYDARTGG